MIQPSAARALLTEWRQLTREGIDASRAHCAVQALTLHEQALRVAHRLLNADDAAFDVSDDDRLAAFVVAHLNLAECLQATDQASSAGECLRCAHNRLTRILQDEAERESMRLAASKHIRYTYAALSDHHAEHGRDLHAVDGLRSSTESHLRPRGSLLH